MIYILREFLVIYVSFTPLKSILTPCYKRKRFAINMNLAFKTFLFLRIFADSYIMPDVPPMINSYILKDGQIIYGEILNTDYQIAVSAFQTGNKLAVGKYTLNLLDKKSDFKLKFGEIHYNDTERKDWVRIPQLEWVDIPVDGLYKWCIQLQCDCNITSHNLTYIVFVKIKGTTKNIKKEN